MDVLDIEGKTRINLAFAANTAVQTAAAARATTYAIWSTVDCFLKIDEVADDVTLTTGYPLFAGNLVPFACGTNSKVGVIGATAGTLSLFPVN